MSGYRSFAKNVGLLTIANFGTKFLSFFLVPLYTSVLTTAEYGIYDLVNTTIGILIPVLTQNIVDAVLRFSIGSGDGASKVLGIGLRHLLISLVPVCIFLGANYAVCFLPSIRELSLLIFLMYLSQALSGMVLYYARGANRFGDIAVSSVFCSVITLCLNVVFLVFLKWGLPGYFVANIVGPLLQSIFLLVRVGFHGASPVRVDKGLERSMLEYSRPLVANSAAWWVNNVSDRYIVTFFCGLSANGIYSLASKIPSILSIFQTIFNQAWTISAVEEFDPEDSNGFFSGMYSVYNCGMVVLCSAIILMDVPLAGFLYSGEFFKAWEYVPFLTIAIVFGAVSGYVEGIFAAVKDSKRCAQTTVVGAVSNIVINLALVPLIGPLGSAIATAACYGLTWYLRMRALRDYIHLHIDYRRDYISYAILVAQGVLLLVLHDNLVVMYTAQIVCLMFIVAMYRHDLVRIIRKLGTVARKRGL